MKRYFMIAAIAAAACIGLSSCGTIDNIKAGITVATSASITRNEALEAIQTTKTLQDLATSYMNTCVSTQSVTGLCKPEAVEAIHKALVATRQPRAALAAFANAHAGAELGASGLYDALIAAKSSLSAVLTQYGYAVPT